MTYGFSRGLGTLAWATIFHCPLILYTSALAVLDADMAQYIHDNTEDELTHEVFINAYLASKGADTVNLDEFRTLPSSQATGAQQIGRLTNLMQLTVDTSWWTRYRSGTKNPDFGDSFDPAVAPRNAWSLHNAFTGAAKASHAHDDPHPRHPGARQVLRHVYRGGRNRA